MNWMQYSNNAQIKGYTYIFNIRIFTNLLCKTAIHTLCRLLENQTVFITQKWKIKTKKITVSMLNKAEKYRTFLFSLSVNWYFEIPWFPTATGFNIILKELLLLTVDTYSIVVAVVVVVVIHNVCYILLTHIMNAKQVLRWKTQYFYSVGCQNIIRCSDTYNTHRNARVHIHTHISTDMTAQYTIHTYVRWIKLLINTTSTVRFVFIFLPHKIFS